MSHKAERVSDAGAAAAMYAKECADLRAKLAVALAERDAAIEDAANLRIHSVTCNDDGSVDIKASAEVVTFLAVELGNFVRGHNAPNYVSMKMVDPKDDEVYEMSVRRVGKGAKTAHELREIAEAENAELRRYKAAVEWMEGWMNRRNGNGVELYGTAPYQSCRLTVDYDATTVEDEMAPTLLAAIEAVRDKDQEAGR